MPKVEVIDRLFHNGKEVLPGKTLTLSDDEFLMLSGLPQPPVRLKEEKPKEEKSKTEGQGEGESGDKLTGTEAP